MKKTYIKPAYRPIELKQRVLAYGSQPEEKVNIYFGGKGTLDAKGCSFDSLEEDDY